jgi:hypothetical protein
MLNPGIEKTPKTIIPRTTSAVETGRMRTSFVIFIETKFLSAAVHPQQAAYALYTSCIRIVNTAPAAKFRLSQTAPA